MRYRLTELRRGQYWYDYTHEGLRDTIKSNPLTKDQFSSFLEKKVKEVLFVTYLPDAFGTIKPLRYGKFIITMRWNSL